MKYSYYFAIVNLWLCAGLLLVSCEKSLEFAVPLDEIVFDSYPIEPVTIDITSDVEWTATVIQEEEWLIVTPNQGKGSERITLRARENASFTERTAQIAITANGIRTDTIHVIQEGSVDIAEKIEDKFFRQYCLDTFDNAPQDGRLSLKEAKGIYEINTKGMKIKSLAGIEYFINLRTLNCSDNLIGNIDLSKNKEIRVLNCSYNPIDKIELGELVKLTDLLIYGANLTKLDVSKNVTLIWLSVSQNQLTDIDVSKNVELQILECNENQLTNINVSNNTKLMSLYCGSNKLSQINVEKNQDLLHLWCNNNLLSSIEIGQNSKLQTFSCANNNFTSINVTKNIKLTQLRCDANQLSSIDVTNNTELLDLKCSSNRLTKNVDISKNKKLLYIDFQNNKELDVIYVWSTFDKNNTYYKKDSETKYVEK